MINVVPSQILSPEELVDAFRNHLGESLLDSRVVKRTDGRNKNETVQIWLTIPRQVIKKTVRKLMELHYPHLAVISGCDTGENIDLMYHLFIYYGRPGGEYNITIRTSVPKNDPTIDTIADLIPGALTSEREKQEFFGIVINDIPDKRRIFLPDDFPQGVYPWRKDDTGIKDNMVKKLYEVGRAECNAQSCCRNNIPGKQPGADKSNETGSQEE